MQKIYINEEQIKELLGPRPKDCNKGDFGYVALIGGSIEYSGAIRLAALANAAMRSGAGVASVAAPRSICPVIAAGILEPTLIPLSDRDGELEFREEEFEKICRRYDAIAFGMGVGLSDDTVEAVKYLLGHYDRRLIVDADGLNAMSKLDRDVIRNTKADLVLTPHVKEFSRLSGLGVDEIKADPEGSVMRLSDELGAVVLLKGSETYVSEPHGAACCSGGGDGDRRVFVSGRGCPGMATAGSGDVLSGILSALCVNAEDLTLAAAAGAYINGMAGEIAESRSSDISMTASDTASCIAEAINIIRMS